MQDDHKLIFNLVIFECNLVVCGRFFHHYHLSMQKIQPEFISIYRYLWDQNESSVEIVVHVPNGLNFEKIHFELLKDNTCFLGTIENEVPFLAGKLWDSVKSFHLNELKEEGKIQLLLFKTKPNEWSQVIHGPITDSNIIDPCSALSIGILAMEDESQQQSAMQLIGYSASLWYPPALNFAANLALKRDRIDEAIHLSSIAAGYNDLDAIFTLGMISIKKEKYDDAINYFQNSSSKGHIGSMVCLGELYSPLVEPHIKEENAELAVQYFNQILQIDPIHSYTLLNLARHYLAGCGVPVDVSKAKELYEHAKSIDENLPELEFPQ